MNTLFNRGTKLTSVQKYCRLTFFTQQTDRSSYKDVMFLRIIF